MDFFSQLQLHYEPVYSSFINLNESEWKLMIKTFCIRLMNRQVGALLVNKLLTFIERGNKITIANCDFTYSRAIYPKIKYVNSKSILIVIPSVPYFTKVETISSKICEEASDAFMRNLDGIVKLRPSKYRLNFDTIHRDYAFLISRTPMSFFICFAHELIHGLRHFEGMNLNPSVDEEDNTIYGIDGYTLKYIVGNDQVFITENAIRKENGYDPRVSHESFEVFCYDVRHTYLNQRLFSKDDYFI